MRLMIIGDLEGQIGAATRIARSRGAKVTQVAGVDEAVEMLCKGQGADLVMIHVDEDIARLVKMLEAERISLEIVACGVEANPEQAVKAIKAGAKEYIPLPPDEELIAAVLEAVTEEARSVIFKSPAMQAVMRMVDQIAPSDASVLITGESGTGKEVAARYIHQKSKRADKAFVSVNCAAIPENLLESELFGHEKGAFTGALNRRIGKFEEADGGTLLLDEISEMDLKLQAKLLRAIQEQEIDRVGGSKPVKIDIRILATSNRDLPETVQKGLFREDLYYRLNVISVALPPLRERPEDISLLAEHFIEKYSKANGLPPRRFTSEALAKIKAYPWPGNVRELENIMHRTVLMAQGAQIEAEAVMLPKHSAYASAPTPAAAPSAPPAAPAGGTGYSIPADEISHLVGRKVEEVEKDLILRTLDHCLGNRTHAANILGISIRTLRNKLKQYGEAEGF